jgi:hypothetical protein
MKLIAGRHFCWGCEQALVSKADLAGESDAGAPPGTIPCTGCGHPKKPGQLKDISGGLYCVNCERKLVAAFSSSVLPKGAGAAPAAREPATPAPAAGTGSGERAAADFGETELSEERIAEREEHKRLLEEAKRRAREREESRRIESGLVRWPDVELPPELAPPEDPVAARERPSPELPEKSFPNTGATRWWWMLAGLLFAGLALGPLATGIGGTYPVIAGAFGFVISVYFTADSFGGIRVDTQGLWRDSIVARKRVFWGSMRAVEIVQEGLPGLAFASGFYSRLYFQVTTVDGRKLRVPVGAMFGKPCVRDFDGLKRHLKTGALANVVKVVEKPGGVS